MNNLFTTPEADAARQLFYFMAGRAPMDATALKAVWLSAGLGLKATDVRNAINNAKILRDEFNATNMRNVRFGLQRVFLNFLGEAGSREERVPNNWGDQILAGDRGCSRLRANQRELPRALASVHHHINY